MTADRFRDVADSPTREPMRPRRGVPRMRQGTRAHLPRKRDHAPTTYYRPTDRKRDH